MTNHTTYVAWPVTCKDCSAITTANFKQTPLVCEVCKSNNVAKITNPHGWKGDGEVSPGRLAQPVRLLMRLLRSDELPRTLTPQEQAASAARIKAYAATMASGELAPSSDRVVEPSINPDVVRVIERWGDLTLTNGHYRCPKCDKFELRFGTNVGGHGWIDWD